MCAAVSNANGLGKEIFCRKRVIILSQELFEIKKKVLTQKFQFQTIKCIKISTTIQMYVSSKIPPHYTQREKSKKKILDLHTNF